MELTGKCKEDFEKWLINNEEIQDIKNKDKDMHHWLTFKGFNNLHYTMKIGVLVKFFWHNGICVPHYWVSILIGEIEYKDYVFTKIENANKMYNDKKINY
jgi:hypothetical protein